MVQRIDFANLTITVRENADEVIYAFTGDVDENFRQQDVPRPAKKSVIFELANIRNFNSVGIREWIYLVKDFSGKNDLVFVECSVTMIDQINMVPDSLGTGRIESFYAPYFCECKEGGETSRLINVQDNSGLLANKQAPEFDCEHCGRPLEFDALEDSYFLFANNAGALPKVS